MSKRSRAFDVDLLAFGHSARAVHRPPSGSDAYRIVDSWLQCPNVVVLDAGERLWEIFQLPMVEAQVSGPLVTDSALAALALEHGATLCSTNRDFRRFRGLKLLDRALPPRRT